MSGTCGPAFPAGADTEALVARALAERVRLVLAPLRAVVVEDQCVGPRCDDVGERVVGVGAQIVEHVVNHVLDLPLVHADQIQRCRIHPVQVLGDYDHWFLG